MNTLVVGTHKTEILNHLPATFLFVDDGPLIDAIHLPKHRKITHLNFSKHSFNPLKDMDYRRARQFIAVLDAIFPEGANTLTKKTSNFVLLNALLSDAERLDTLIRLPKKNDAGALDAYQKIQTLLLSPVLEPFLCRPTNFSFDGILLARLDRAKLSEFDCFVIANLLISNYTGAVVVPDFGFYGCSFHTSLIRQDRLIAGVNALAEIPTLRTNLLTIPNKIAKHALVEDAETLADYCGFPRGSVGYQSFVERCL